MFGYYLDLAWRSLRRHKVLTALMVGTLAVGIGASITTLTVLHLLSGDPIPHKSARLFYPQIDPDPANATPQSAGRLRPLMSYMDAMALLRAHKAQRQTAVALTPAKIAPAAAGRRPFFSNGVMTTRDFFAMFDVPFAYGGAWTQADGNGGARVVVIADYLNEKLFGGADSVGQTLRIDDQDFRIVGVLRHWAPQPCFYALGMSGRNYGDGDAVFMPIEAALDAHISPEMVMCYDKGDFDALKTAPCTWLGVWVQLAMPAQAQDYRRFLSGYVHQQIAQGRFSDSKVALPDLMQRLRKAHAVPDDVRLQTSVALGFLLICVVNTVGLLLAKCLRRSREIGVRRALGASRATIFAQFLVESAVVGVAGGVLGLVLAMLGLWGIRHQPTGYAKLAHLDPAMLGFTFVVALTASVLAGLLPAWRACVIAPAPQLKSS